MIRFGTRGRKPLEMQPAAADLSPLAYFHKHKQAVAAALQRPGDDIVASGLVHRSPYGAVLKVYDKRSQRYLAVKICLDPLSQNPSGERCSSEYSTLLARSRATHPGGESHCVRPVAAIASLGLLIREWVDGESALCRLNGLRTEAERLDLFYRLGRWVAQFHQQNGVTTGEISSSELVKTRDLGSRHRDPAPFKSICRHYRLAIVSLLDEIDSSAGHMAHLHGDYHLENVIVSAQGKGVLLDPSKGDPGDLVVLDLAIFLNYLRRFCVLPKGWRHLRAFRKYRESFLRGYRSYSVEISTRLLVIVEAMDLFSFSVRLDRKTHNRAKLFYLRAAYLMAVGRILRGL
jgi:hypothetical protein